MKANPDNCHFITSGDEVSICVENYSITSSKYEKRLDIKVNTKLNFTNYIDEIWKKAGQKLSTLSVGIINCVFLISIQLLPTSLDNSKHW